PADITGTAIYNQKTGEFEFREGPVFANIVLADEINRASPKTQSSLLECMEEGQVTSDGITYELPRPFLVIATENNIDAHGTYPLPEAQMDRFLMRLSMGYPQRDEEARILESRIRATPLAEMHPIVTQSELLALQAEVREVYLDASLRNYIVDVVTATRNHPQILLGASPRGSLFLLHAAQAYAALQSRTFVLPDDIKRLAPAILAHRVILRPEARPRPGAAEALIVSLLDRVPVPVSG
ncbi:MAG: MoxR family ATPase, partial [Armatimonadota bacterium]|nr:MoxR family ATPase [Armatimonadota bacterium]